MDPLLHAWEHDLDRHRRGDRMRRSVPKPTFPDAAADVGFYGKADLPSVDVRVIRVAKP
jgi:hypothetical protein